VYVCTFEIPYQADSIRLSLLIAQSQALMKSYPVAPNSQTGCAEDHRPKFRKDSRV
jgi:hypothetical protein